VYVYGSGECEQLGIEFAEDAMCEIKRAKRIPKFDMTLLEVEVKIPICRLSVGGMHALALTTAGTIYSWGCNDDGALGRTGEENSPLLVQELPIKVNAISAGDCHSVAYNTDTSQAYMWGLYRVSQVL